MTGKEVLLIAADEARDAAQEARELASLLDEYADCLELPDQQERARELHLIALSKLQVVRVALREASADSDERLDETG